MTKIEREQKRVDSLRRYQVVIPAINNLLGKAEPYILTYNKALKNYWENGKDREKLEKELMINGLISSFEPHYERFSTPNWNYDLLQLDKNYKELLKI